MLKGSKIFINLLLIYMVSSVYLFPSIMGAVKGHIYQKGTDTPLFKVKITIISIKSKTLRHELFSDKKGYFYKSGLRPGLYLIKYEKNGYVPVKNSIRIHISETHKVN
ncbi:MAG: carboxypeptidase regulatory-like domain-containing protein, partial [Candidatus Aminicenantes bacterium]|nr:carboxypeptidase regulatory-like domain-containing protein [Candidatus Aminicenantes bacterium]